MTYATPAELLAAFDPAEIAGRADRSLPPLVSPELLQAAAQGGDLSAWTPEEQAAAGVALVRVTQALVRAGSSIDGYVYPRYAVPLVVVPEMVKQIACDLARYYLYDDQVTETIQNRRDEAVSALRDISSGRLSLGPVGEAGGSVVPAQSGATVEITSSPQVWSHRGPR
ncbi:DUF1320 domain-containing protein [Denitratisoma sp. agr-D3]